jgi:geranylgeranyl pyrophosphate synthase
MLLQSNAFGRTATVRERAETVTSHWVESESLLARLEDELLGTLEIGGPLGAAARHHFASGGKRFRGRLSLATGLAAGLSEDEALPAAIAVELLHNASLVHDDLQDGDVTRRGQRSVWSAFGADVAVLLGDTLIAYAIAASARGPMGTAGDATAAMARCVGRLAEGQARDTEPPPSTEWTPQAYDWIARHKTGELLALAVQLPLLHAGATRTDLAHAGTAAELIGVGYQILDDIADLTSAKGRDAGTDLRSARMSSVLVHHLLGCGAQAARSLHRDLARTRLDGGGDEGRTTIFDLVAGPAVPACLAHQRRCFDAALRNAEVLHSDVVAVLQESAGEIRRRTFRTVAAARGERLDPDFLQRTP